jgi:uncharacterized protein
VTGNSFWPADVAWRRVSGRLFVLAALPYLAVLVTVAGACAAGCAVGAVIVVRLGFLPRSLRSWGYAERGDDLLVRHGILYRRLSIVPYGRMQFVDVTAGPLERLLGLATVQLHTAAAATDARIPGLPPAEAARLRDRLTALGEARAEGL